MTRDQHRLSPVVGFLRNPSLRIRAAGPISKRAEHCQREYLRIVECWGRLYHRASGFGETGLRGKRFIVRGLAAERQERIVGLLREHGFVRNSELSGQLGVSIVTVRQDVEALRNRGIVRKTFGGALLHEEGRVDSAFTQRADQYRAEKQRIGAAAAAMIQPGETVLLDAGSTTIEIARRLPENADVTVVTCALNIALEAASREGVQVVVCGGELNPRTLSVTGRRAEQTLAEYHADRLFLATYGVDPARGLAERNLAGAELKRALIAAAREVVLVCDSSKFGATAPVHFATLDAIGTVITDRGIPPKFRRQMQKRSIALSQV